MTDERKEQKERAERHGCNGICYGGEYDDDGNYIEYCCLGIDTCEETRGKEFAASVLAVLMDVLLHAIILGLLALLLFKCF